MGGKLIRRDTLGWTGTQTSGALLNEVRKADGAIPDMLVIGFGDPSRDFQPGQQRAVRRTPALRGEQHDLPIAATAGAGKQLAEAMLRRAIARRNTATLATSWRYATLQPGDVVAIEGSPDRWRIRRLTLSGPLVEFELERVASVAGDALPVADAGRAYLADDAPNGPTVLHVLDLPALGGAVAVSSRLLLAAAGRSKGWRRADILISRDGGESYAAMATVDSPAAIGTALGTLPSGVADRWDYASTVEVELLGDDMLLEGASETAVLAGANVALIGDEIVQFARADAIGARRFRLSTLLRGRRGSEAAMSLHISGERFVLLDSDRLFTVALPLEAIGSTQLIKAVSPGEDSAVSTAIAVTPHGATLRPLSPVSMTITATLARAWSIGWIRRSRGGFAWLDNIDAPLAEDTETYRVAVMLDGIAVRQVEVGEPHWVYAAEDFAADGGASAAILTIAVTQLSALAGPGAPLTKRFDLQSRQFLPER